MTRDTPSPATGSTRRRFLAGAGTAGVVGGIGLTGSASALLGDAIGGLVSIGDTLVDDALDLESDEEQEVIVVFEENEDADRLLNLDVLVGRFAVLPMAYAELTGPLIERVAGWDDVRYVSANYELEYYNDDARASTRADQVQAGEGLESGYTGENAHAVVIDSGVDGAHPDLEENLQANLQYVGIPEVTEPLWWQDVGFVDSDNSGHGTHCSGSVAGNGSASDGEYAGMAPDADLTVYSCGAGGLLVVYVVAAYDDMLRRQQEGEHDVQVVSNSYGPVDDDRPFVPDEPTNVATWHAHEAGILPVFAAGNSGPENGTLSQFAKAPHVLGVAATHADQTVTDFSSRGRSQDGSWDHDNYDRETAYENLTALHAETDEDEVDGPLGIYRNGVAAKGGDVMSTLNPADPLNAVEPDDELYYGLMSGTSMSCPVTAGCATLVVDAYVENHGEAPRPIDVLTTLEATAVEDVHDTYTAESVGAGYVDALAAVERAEAGDLAGFDEIEIAPGNHE
ncbi:S8 family peptidase [Natronococcus wangiae]|uniref:S8 family peptidase n=1 Tax=Natronococcus wangiae TaxID=3068275 RepID=UPI00273E7C02|nr:S8 family serine peptidase [Natronococcus sp. AD5]